MKLGFLQGEKTIGDVVKRLFDGRLDSKGLEAARGALLAANPHLAGGVAALPAGTPVVIPSIEGATTSAAQFDPRLDALMTILTGSADAAKKAASGAAQKDGSPVAMRFAGMAPALGAAAPPAGVPDKEKQAIAAALSALAADVEAFDKLHRGSQEGRTP